MRWCKLILVCIVALAVTGCALFRPTGSWVGGELSERDGAPIAQHIADLAAEHLPKGAAIAIAPASGNAAGAVAAHLSEALKARGLTVVETGGTPKKEEVHALRYVVSPYGDGVLLRVHLDGAEVSTVLSRRTDGELIASAPLSVREAVQ